MVFRWSPFLGIAAGAMLMVVLGLLPRLAVGQTQKTAPSSQVSGVLTEPVRVTVTPLENTWVYPMREAPAEVRALNESRLAAQVSGTLQRWLVDVGDPVRAGQLLAEIDPRDAQLDVQRTQAALSASQVRLKLAQLQLKRAQDLVVQGFFSQEALAQRETEVALLRSEVLANQAQLASSRRQLTKTRLYAPFAASVTQRLAQSGEAVAPGTVLYVMTQTGDAQVLAALSPPDVAGLRRATQVQLQTAGGGFALRVLRVGPTVEAPARSQQVRLAFVSSDGGPPAGTSGVLRWRDPQPHIPPELLVRRGSILGVFVQQGSEGAATARFVALPGAQEGRATPVAATSALSPRTPVIALGQAALQNDQRIVVQAAQPDRPKGGGDAL